MMNEIYFPKFELSKDELLWLNEIWTRTIETGEIPEYKSIRLSLLDKLDTGFVPLDIDQTLLKKSATEISLLGVLNIVPDLTILNDANKIIKHIKNKIVEDPEFNHFSMGIIANELNLNKNYASVVFNLIKECGSFYSGAGKQASEAKMFGYIEFDIQHPNVFDEYIRFSDIKNNITKHYRKIEEFNKPLNTVIQNESKNLHEEDILFIDEMGHLIFNETILIEKIKKAEILNSDCFVDVTRINEIKNLNQTNFDLSKLIKLSEELNISFSFKNYYSITLLTRAIIDHIPPIFGYQNFKELANNYKSDGNSRSFKNQMLHLENSSRNISDTHIHSQIRKAESLPNAVQVDFRNDLDVLLGEIVRILK